MLGLGSRDAMGGHSGCRSRPGLSDRGKSMTFRRALFRAGALIATLLCNSISPLLAQQGPAGAEIPGERLPAAPSVAESTADIMLRQSVTPPSFAPRVKVERELEVDRQANPYAPSVPYWPYN